MLAVAVPPVTAGAQNGRPWGEGDGEENGGFLRRTGDRRPVFWNGLQLLDGLAVVAISLEL